MTDNFNDVSDAFDGWMQTVIGSRVSGAYVSGRWVPGTPVALSFPGVVQNATADDLKVLEEGLRTTEAIKVHTTFELIAQAGSTTTGDTLTYKGVTWLVHNVADRHIGNYFKAIAVRQ